MQRIVFVIFFIFSILLHGELEAQTSASSPTLESANLGSLSFYLDKKNPATQGESVHLVEGSKAYFCLQLNTQVPDLKEAASHLMQVEIILQGEGENPQKIRAASKFRKDIIYPNTQGCWIGQLTVPLGTPFGKYRVAEIDLKLASQHSISLRDRLAQITPLGLVEVASPIKDMTPPLVEKIESWVPLIGKMNMRFKRAWKYLYFRVTATDQMVGIDPSSFQIFFKVYIDDELIDIIKPRCRTVLPNMHYDCNLYFSRAEHDFYGRTLKLVLDSIGVADKHGNWAELNTPEQLKKIFDGKLLSYTFYSHKLPKQSESQNAEEPDLDDHSIRSSDPKQDYINKLKRP